MRDIRHFRPQTSWHAHRIAQRHLAAAQRAWRGFCGRSVDAMRNREEETFA